MHAASLLRSPSVSAHENWNARAGSVEERRTAFNTAGLGRAYVHLGTHSAPSSCRLRLILAAVPLCICIAKVRGRVGRREPQWRVFAKKCCSSARPPGGVVFIDFRHSRQRARARTARQAYDSLPSRDPRPAKTRGVRFDFPPLPPRRTTWPAQSMYPRSGPVQWHSLATALGGSSVQPACTRAAATLLGGGAACAAQSACAQCAHHLQMPPSDSMSFVGWCACPLRAPRASSVAAVFHDSSVAPEAPRARRPSPMCPVSRSRRETRARSRLPRRVCTPPRARARCFRRPSRLGRWRNCAIEGGRGCERTWDDGSPGR